MHFHAVVLSTLLAAATCAAAQAQAPQPRRTTNFTKGANHERGTVIQLAPRARGTAMPRGAPLPPRSQADVWTSKLVYHAWAMESVVGNGDHDVYFARSTDGGSIFSPPRRLETQAGNAREVSVCAAESRVYVSWISDEIGNLDQVYAAVSADQGRTFSAPIMMNEPSLAQRADADEHWASATGHLFYAVWEFDDRGRIANLPIEDIHFSYLIVDDLGNITQGEDVRVNTPPGSTLYTALTPLVVTEPDDSSTDVAVLWFDARGGPQLALHGVWSRAFGFDFPLPQDRQVVGAPADLAAKKNVTAALQDQLLHLAWEDRRNAASGGGADELYYDRVDLRDGSQAHPGGLRLVDWPQLGSGDVDQPFLAIDAADARQLVVAWHDNRDRGGSGNDSVNDTFVTLSRDAGLTWTNNARLSQGSGLGTGQRNECWGAAWDGDHVVVSVTRSELNTIGGPGAGTEDALLFTSRDGGRSWEELFVTAVGSSFGLANDVSAPFLALSRVRHDIAVAFFDDSYNNVQGHGDLLTGGLRLPYLTTSSPPQGGQALRFTLGQIGASQQGGTVLLVFNAASSGTVPGFLPFGSGIDLDLVPDAFTQAFAGITPLTVLGVQPDGTAASPPVLVPAGYVGPVFQVQGLVFDAQLRMQESTDVLRL